MELITNQKNCSCSASVKEFHFFNYHFISCKKMRFKINWTDFDKLANNKRKWTDYYWWAMGMSRTVTEKWNKNKVQETKTNKKTTNEKRGKMVSFFIVHWIQINSGTLIKNWGLCAFLRHLNGRRIPTIVDCILVCVLLFFVFILQFCSPLFVAILIIFLISVNPNT